MAKAALSQKGALIDYNNGGVAAIEYGDIIPLVSRIGVAAENIAVGADGSVSLEGVYIIPAITTAAFAVGDLLYFDATAGKVTKTATDNTPAGTCVAVKAQATDTAAVRIG